MASCPCCSNSMIRHFRNHQVHWFCRTCWQPMPLFEAKALNVVSESPLAIEKPLWQSLELLLKI